MMRKTISQLTLFQCLIAMTFIIGCGGKSFDYHSAEEIPEGPGVLSGSRGEFTLYNSESRQRGKTRSVAEGNKIPPKSGDYREFQEFQQWKKEKSQFDNFQEWRKTNKGSREYKEFLEWQRWREYQQWQEKQKKSN